MAIVVRASGTHTPALTATEYTMQTAGFGTTFSLGSATGQLTTSGIYVLQVDTKNLVAGEVVELRCYLSTLAVGDEQLAYYAVYSNVQGQKIKMTVPIPSDISVKFTIKQTGGTMRAYILKAITI